MNRRTLAPAAIGVWTLLSSLIVVLDFSTPLATVVAVPFLLLGPGLALTTLMAAMGPVYRLVFAAATSLAVVTVVSALFHALGAWSGALTYVMVGLLTQLVLLAGLAPHMPRTGAAPAHALVQAPEEGTPT